MELLEMEGEMCGEVGEAEDPLQLAVGGIR